MAAKNTAPQPPCRKIRRDGTTRLLRTPRLALVAKVVSAPSGAERQVGEGRAKSHALAEGRDTRPVRACVPKLAMSARGRTSSPACAPEEFSQKALQGSLAI